MIPFVQTVHSFTPTTETANESAFTPTIHHLNTTNMGFLVYDPSRMAVFRLKTLSSPPVSVADTKTCPYVSRQITAGALEMLNETINHKPTGTTFQGQFREAAAWSSGILNRSGLVPSHLCEKTCSHNESMNYLVELLKSVDDKGMVELFNNVTDRKTKKILSISAFQNFLYCYIRQLHKSISKDGGSKHLIFSQIRTRLAKMRAHLHTNECRSQLEPHIKYMDTQVSGIGNVVQTHTLLDGLDLAQLEIPAKHMAESKNTSKQSSDERSIFQDLHALSGLCN